MAGQTKHRTRDHPLIVWRLAYRAQPAAPAEERCRPGRRGARAVVVSGAGAGGWYSAAHSLGTVNGSGVCGGARLVSCGTHRGAAPQAPRQVAASIARHAARRQRRRAGRLLLLSGVPHNVISRWMEIEAAVQEFAKQHWAACCARRWPACKRANLRVRTVTLLAVCGGWWCGPCPRSP